MTVEISQSSELPVLEADIRRAAASMIDALCDAAAQHDPIDVLRAIKFRGVGFDPLNPTRPLNIIEQVNQTFTYLVSLRAVEYLLREHPESAPFRLNLGARAGTDIESADGQVVAEVFAAVRPNNNDKMRKDIARVRMSTAPHRYVFFYAEEVGTIPPTSDIRIVQVSLDPPSPT